MSAGLAGAVSDQRMKGQANSQVSNGPKEHQQQQQQQAEHVGGEDAGFESWRGGNNVQHHSSYPIGTGDPYSPYYGNSFPYQAFGAGDGTWSNGTDPVAFLSGYGGQMGHDSYGMDGMFSASGGGGFSTFGQPFNYFHGNGDYSTWGTPRKTRYEDYYQPPRGNENYSTGGSTEMKTIEQSVQGLSIGAETSRQEQQQQQLQQQQQQQQPNLQSNKNDLKEPKKMTWASVASQPAKPVPPLSTSQGMKKKAGMPPPPMVPGKHNMDIGTWGEGKSAPAIPPKAPPPPQVQPPVPPPPPPVQRQRPPPQPCWVRQPTSPPPPAQMQMPPQPVPPLLSHPVLDELKVKNDYNPTDFDQSAPGAKFFVIKSYSEDDIHRSIKYEIWCSTEHGNKRLDQAYRDATREGAPLYLFFSVNGSGHFCGMAQMVSAVDYQSNSSVWSQDKWKGQFRVRWIYVKDVPNVQLRHIRLENNENKPVTNSRDAQEVPHARGLQVLRILHTYRHSTSIFDDFGHYERRQAEEDQRKVPPTPVQHHHPPNNHRGRGNPGEPPHHQQQAQQQQMQQQHQSHQQHQPQQQQHHQHSHQHSQQHPRKDRDGGRGRGRGGPRQ